MTTGAAGEQGPRHDGSRPVDGTFGGKHSVTGVVTRRDPGLEHRVHERERAVRVLKEVATASQLAAHVVSGGLCETEAVERAS